MCKFINYAGQSSLGGQFSAEGKRRGMVEVGGYSRVVLCQAVGDEL